MSELFFKQNREALKALGVTTEVTPEDFKNRARLKKKLSKAHRQLEKGPADPFLVQLGQDIRAKRTGQKLDLKDVAKKGGINHCNLSQIENGQVNPSVKILQKIAEGLGMELRIEFVRKYVQTG